MQFIAIWKKKNGFHTKRVNTWARARAKRLMWTINTNFIRNSQNEKWKMCDSYSAFKRCAFLPWTMGRRRKNTPRKLSSFRSFVCVWHASNGANSFGHVKDFLLLNAHWTRQTRRRWGRRRWRWNGRRIETKTGEMECKEMKKKKTKKIAATGSGWNTRSTGDAYVSSFEVRVKTKLVCVQFQRSPTYRCVSPNVFGRSFLFLLLGLDSPLITSAADRLERSKRKRTAEEMSEKERKREEEERKQSISWTFKCK